ncbi:MAG: enoyl-CoA hydratase/isomerase family protein [Acidimicrobiia bacterium]
MELDEIAYSKADGVARIVLNRPDRLNPISARPGGTRDQILWGLADAQADPEIGAVLIHGAGKAFSAGGDITGNKPRETPFEQAQFIDGAERFHRAIRECALPVIAAVHGYCFGAALSLVASCDIVIAGTSASFSLPEGRLGLVGVSPLVTVVGRQWAKFMMFSGEPINAELARQIGLVLTIEPDDDLIERAADLGSRLSRLPREALTLTKKGIDAIADAAGDQAGRTVAAMSDSLVLANSPRANAPDGRPFREIIATEGMEGMKKARAAQYSTPWLR